MVKVEHGTLLGKCAVDGQPIFEGSGNRSMHCTLVNGKWLSGDILLKIYPQVFAAFLDEHKDKEKEKEILLGRLSEFGWQVNPVTGKLTKL